RLRLLHDGRRLGQRDDHSKVGALDPRLGGAERRGKEPGMVNRARRKAGYTLVEVMAAVAIIAVTASIGAALLKQVNRFFILSKAKSDLQKEARAIMYVVSREIRQAQSATIVLSRASGAQPYYS